MPRICDYEGSRYRTEFWEGQNRRYEDLAERIALQRMLPPSGERLIEVGAGFGRLADLYQGYEQVVLTDYARSQLQEAQRYLGDDQRFTYVVADVYHMPFVAHRFEALVMIRVMHHLVDVPAALAELQRITAPAGTAVIEHASKRHLKAILRWLMRRQDWNPFDPDPHEFVELNIDFHPTWMRRQFQAAGFTVQATRALSYYRLPLLKELIPPHLLAALDGLTQPLGNWLPYAPSLFLQATPDKPLPEQVDGLFQCPACRNPNLVDTASGLDCPQCGRHYPLEEGIYDFRTPLAGTNALADN